MGNVWIVILVCIVVYFAGVTSGLYVARAAHQIHMRTLDAIFPAEWEDNDNE